MYHEVNFLIVALYHRWQFIRDNFVVIFLATFSGALFFFRRHLVIIFFDSGWGLNIGSCIFYALFQSIELIIFFFRETELINEIFGNMYSFSLIFREFFFKGNLIIFGINFLIIWKWHIEDENYSSYICH